MDQGVFYELDAEFDPEEVKLDEPPKSAEHYLKQVMVDRQLQQAVVTVKVDLARFRGRQTQLVRPEDLQLPRVRRALRPPLEWQLRQVADFSDLRHKLTLVRAKLRRENKLLDLRLPDPQNEVGWHGFCCRRATSQLDLAELAAGCFSAHSGTPPLLRLVLALPHHEASELLCYHVKWFASDGYSAAAAHWLFALMAVVEKPLDPDVLASLRQLARCCHQLRAELSSSTNRRASTESTNESASTDNDEKQSANQRASTILTTEKSTNENASTTDDEKQSANQRASTDLSAEKSTNENASTTDDEKATRPIDDEERNLNLAREFSWFIAVVARYFDQSDLTDVESDEEG